MDILIYISFFLLFIIFLTAGLAGILAAPYLPSRKRDVEEAIKIANIQDGEKIADLGCGDARILLGATRYKDIVAIGYEISLLNVFISKFRVWLWNRKKKKKVIYIKTKNFFSENLTEFDVIFCFLTPKAMKKLSEKFKKECKKGARIISFGFKIPNWEYKKRIKKTNKSIPIFLYTIG